MNPIKDATQEFWLWVRVACLAFFTLSFAINWARKSRIAKSFKIVGLIAMFVFIMTLIVLSFVSSMAFVVAPAFSLVMAAWVNLDSWYFHNYPGYNEWINSPHRPTGTFGLNTRIGKLLIYQDAADCPPQTPAEVSRITWKTGAITTVILLVLLFAFGFARTMDKVAAAAANSRVAAAHAEQLTKQAIDTAVVRSARQFSGQIQSLTTTQKKEGTQLKQVMTATLNQAQKNGMIVAGARVEAAKAAAIAARRNNSFIILPPTPKPSPFPMNVDPRKVRPLPSPSNYPLRRSKNATTSRPMMPSDTSDFARRD